MFLLDTDIASAIIKDRKSIGPAGHFLRESTWGISSITLMELHFGLLSIPQDSPKRTLISGFLAQAPVYEFDSLAAEYSATVRQDLKSKGKPIGAYDPLIAGHALALGAVLVTANTKHFQHIEGLETANWLKN